ncbi:D-alanyl-D-alanine carboxypeptidase [Limoniibacter endophyticus]|uniref:D-alanyl-D-alanine carboxypeptidase n=1 Tax=Limoniibacter endophyticus TaxID=1565040 RepID=A0A8J3GJ82_9HYPH|nr:D-alanyl-D-alanine carboxypeptidase [Limoniibacter endophyticus]
MKRSAAILLCLSVLSGPVHANPSIVFDVKTGQVLGQQEAYQRWHPASLTKLMTVYTGLRALKAGELTLESPIRMTRNAASEPPSKMGYAPGTIITFDNALKILLVKSANDVATAVADNVGGSEKAFVARMNAEARRLGMNDTHFINAHGLHDPQQYTTARDLAVLIRALRSEFPDFASYFGLEGIEVNGKVTANYNLLVGRFDGADGLKTGFVCASGFNLAASATRNGRSLAAVVLGASSQQERAIKAAELLTRGFQTSATAGTNLMAMQPVTKHALAPIDMRPVICNPQAAAERYDGRDTDGNLKIDSPYLHERKHEPRAAVIKVGGATGPVPKALADSLIGGEIADVPIPTPRPVYEFTPATPTVTTGSTERAPAAPQGLFEQKKPQASAIFEELELRGATQASSIPATGLY